MAFLFELSFHVVSPNDLRGIKHNLTSVSDNPVITILNRIVKQSLVENFTHGHDHLFFNIPHPVLNVTFLWVNTLDEFNFFTFDRHHSNHAIIVAEFQVSDCFKHLSQM